MIDVGWHVAPRRARDSIARRGLCCRDVYFWISRSAAERFALLNERTLKFVGGADVWRIDVSGLPVNLRRGSAEGSTSAAIPVERLLGFEPAPTLTGGRAGGDA